MQADLREKKKYEKVWAIDEYRKVSPGALSVDDFFNRLDPWTEVIDFGCGTGRAGKELLSRGVEVLMVDIADNCLDEDIKNKLSERFRFKQVCLWDSFDFKAEYGFCCDVLEHIPEQYVDDVLRNIFNACSKGIYLRIYLHEDNGKFIDEPLHLTVKPWRWWFDKLISLSPQICMNTNETVATFWITRE